MEINEAFDKKTEIWGKEDKSRLVGLFTLDFCMAFFQPKKKKNRLTYWDTSTRILINTHMLHLGITKGIRKLL